MDRIETYIGQSVMEWAFTKPDQNKMVALGELAQTIIGTRTVATGLACTPQSPASMFVSIAAGQIYQQANLEATVCGTLPADTTHQITKQGILLDPVTIPNANTGVTALVAPTTSGQSVNYLVEAQYADQDISIDPTDGASNVVLPFYNASNPSQPYQGPNNSGLSSNTFRKGIVNLQIKAGIAATTGSQATPTPDSGFVGLWVITVPYGATTLTTANILAYPGAPLLSKSLLTSIIVGNLAYGSDVGAVNAPAGSYPLPVTELNDNMTCWVNIANSNTGATTFTPNPGVIAAAPVLGAGYYPLQGGELPAGGRALLVWRASVGSWVLAFCTGGALQVAPATQSYHAVQLGQTTPAYSISAIPTTKVANAILVIESGEIWPWVSTAYYTGYRSVNIGSPIASAYVTPRAHEIDAVGGTLSQTTYARLWAFAQENGLVVASGSWVAGALNFVNLGSGNFQAPDLRNMFIRLAAGATDPDTANVRTLGSYKADEFKSHIHNFNADPAGYGASTGNGYTGVRVGTTPNVEGQIIAAVGAAETAPRHVAAYPRLHI